MNQLAQLLALYDQNMPGGRSNMDMGMSMTQGAMNQRRAMDANNSANRRLGWATNMMRGGRGGSDFFRDEPTPQLPGYVAPQAFTEQMPQRQMQQAPMSGDIQNLLARLLRG